LTDNFFLLPSPFSLKRPACLTRRRDGATKTYESAPERSNTPSAPFDQEVTFKQDFLPPRHGVTKKIKNKKGSTWCLGVLVAKLALCTGTKIKLLKILKRCVVAASREAGSGLQSRIENLSQESNPG
jgi:hypothetical protein